MDSVHRSFGTLCRAGGGGCARCAQAHPIFGSSLRGHSITTWTQRGGEGGSQMSTIVHAREGGGLRNVHMDKIFGKMQFFAASDISW